MSKLDRPPRRPVPAFLIHTPVTQAGAVFALALLIATPVQGKPRKPDGDINHGKELAACLKLAEATPDAGFESALIWQGRGGGDLARLCQAMALFHRGQFDAAGTRLEELAPVLGKDNPKTASILLSRAGWAWLRAGRAEHAEALYTQALKHQPNDADLHIDRAFARAELEKYWDAVADLSTVIEQAPRRHDALVYRAAAYKHLDNLELAMRDVAQALTLAPNDPEALLMRGNLRALRGDLAEACEDWKQVARLDPDTTTARSAEANLARFADAAPAR